MPNDFSGAGERASAEPTEPDVPGRDGSGEMLVAGTPVVVRRHAGVAALIGAAASAVAIAYLWRASQTMTVLDWTLCGVMAVIAAYYLVSLVDARTPLLVADDLGVRIRLGDEWRGLPWDAIGQVVVHPRKGFLRDGRLVFLPRSLARALEGLDAKGRRHAALNQKMYGAALAVPVGTTTRLSTARERGVADEIAALALGRADVVELDPHSLEVADRRSDSSKPDGAAVPRDTEASEKAAAPGAADGRREVFPRLHPSDARAKQWPDADAAPVTPGEAVEESETLATDRRVDQAAVQPRWAEQAVDPADPNGPVRPDETGVVGEPASPGVTQGAEEQAVRAPRRSILGGIGTIVSRVAKGRANDVDESAPEQAEPGTAEGAEGPKPPAPGPMPLSPTAALRETRPGLRAEATLNLPTAGTAALDPSPAAAGGRADIPEGRELHRPGSVDLVFERVELDDRVRPISTLGEPVAPLVIDDFVTEPAYDPVIGPELAAARTRLGLSVDDLAERTRIRPHVIESIEVDDFAPCGGDFYARGHLRTLARILGKDVDPLLEKFEERYATAPINARRVFEAELATGMTGSIRSTVGGPSWGLLVGVVLVLVLIWGMLRLFTTGPSEMPAPVINGSALVHSATLGVPGQRPAGS